MYGERQKTQTSQHKVKGDKVTKLTRPAVKTYYKETVIKSVLVVKELTKRSGAQRREYRNRPT